MHECIRGVAITNIKFIAPQGTAFAIIEPNACPLVQNFMNANKKGRKPGLF